MNFMRKKPVRILAITIALLVAAVLAIQLFLPAEKIKELALAQASEKLGREVSAGEVSISLRGGLGVRIADVTVDNPADFEGDPLLVTSSVDLKLALGPLLHGEINVTRLVITNPRLNLLRRADGVANFEFEETTVVQETASSPSGAKAPQSLNMSDVQVQNGFVYFADAALDPNSFESLTLSGCQMTMAVNTASSGALGVVGSLAVDELAVASSASIPVVKVSSRFDLSWDSDSSQLVIAPTQVIAAGVPLVAEGLFTFAHTGLSGSIKLQAEDVALVDLALLLPPEVSGLLVGDREDGLLRATVNIMMAAEAEPVVDGDIAVSEFNLSLVQPFFPPHQTGQIDGRADLALRFSQGDSFTYEGEASIRKMSYRDASLVSELESLDARLLFNTDEISVTESRAQFGAGTFMLSGKLRDPFPYLLPPEMQTEAPEKYPHLSFELSTPHLDVDQLLPVASPATTQSATAQAVATAKTSELPQDFPRVTAAGVFKADSIVYMQVPLTEVVGEITLEDQRLKIENVEGTVYQGSVTGDLEVDLKDMADPVFTGGYDVNDIEMNDFVSRFAGLPGVLFGRFDLKGDFAANGLDPVSVRNNLSLDATGGVESGRLVTSGKTHLALNKLASQAGQSIAAEQTLRDLATHISVSDGRVAVNALQTRLGDFGDLSMDGSYGFDGSIAYSGELLLTKAQTDQWFGDSGLLSGLADLMGSRRPDRLLLPIAVVGTRTKPQLKFDFEALTSDMQQRVVDEQGEKLSDNLAEEAKKKLGGLFDKWK